MKGSEITNIKENYKHLETHEQGLNVQSRPPGAVADKHYGVFILCMSQCQEEVLEDEIQQRIFQL